MSTFTAGQHHADPAPIRLATVEHVLFGEGGPFHPLDRAYFADLWELYGLPWDDEFVSGKRNSFQDMTKHMLDRLGADAERFDVAVLANCTPDAEPGFPMPYLESRSQTGLVYAISDQGAASAFTALRLTAHAEPGDRPRRALVLVLDQSATLPGPSIPDQKRPVHDSAVAIVLDDDSGMGAPHIRTHVQPGPADIVGHLRAQLSDTVPTSVICNPELLEHWRAADADVDIVPTVPGLPCTGPWAALAANLPSWSRTARRVVVSNYDSALGYLNTFRIDL